ncbi:MULTISPECIES: NAD-dependent epimerase/dehydratase family protein [unclassified Bradyrhizobium]|uniref:NAD-dependent epimerase/dehydratase family protein n=1 Tax=unclassified Bradyrhizobium TaxID=2631580 RepID=UPI0028E2EB05|nr:MULTISPECIES: NAD-dependent epimerase/dehydratase family protein [unclassified Bradyrhizobium]
MIASASSPRPPRLALVTGGSGYVGSRLIARLLSESWQVRALARSADSEAKVKSLGASPVPGELNDEQSLRQAMDGCEVVFHVAAHFKLWGQPKVFDAVNVEGTRSVVNAAAATTSVRRVVAVSAAAVVMGDPKPMFDVDESLPLQTRAFSPYGSSKAEGERALLAANGARPGLETVALRPPFIWGGEMPTLDHMVQTVHAGRWQWVSGGEQAMSSCHVDNLCHALLLAADAGRGGHAYFVADAERSTLKSFISSLLATREVTAPDKAISFRMAWIAAGIMGAAWRGLRMKGEPPITRQMLRLIGQPFTISIRKAQAELGYTPQITMHEGLSAMRKTQPKFAGAYAPQVERRASVAS